MDFGKKRADPAGKASADENCGKRALIAPRKKIRAPTGAKVEKFFEGNGFMWV